MAKVAVEVSGMDFSYKKEALFEKFNLTIREGQLIGVVGVNGSGKSTFLKLLAGLLKPQGGRITIHGEKAGSFPSKFLVGASLQEIDFPGTEKAQEVLEFVASQYSEALPISPLIQDYNLKGFTGKACSQLSGGMKRRLSLACALVGRPPVVLLDEPTTGLDTQSRQELMENLKAYKEREEALILMISHYPEEIFEQVDEFYHMRPNAIERLTAERMDQLSRIKKSLFVALKEQAFL